MSAVSSYLCDMFDQGLHKDWRQMRPNLTVFLLASPLTKQKSSLLAVLVSFGLKTLITETRITALAL